MTTGKKTFIGFAILLLLPVLLLAILAVVINPNDYKPLIQQKAAEQGIELAIGGDIHWAFLPRPSFVIANVDAVLPGATRQSVHVGELDMALGIAPLLAGRVEFSNIALRDGNMHIKDSAGNTHTIERINVGIQRLNIQGETFPVTASLHMTQEKLNAQLTLNADVSANLSAGTFAAPSLTLQIQLEGSDIPTGKQTLTLNAQGTQFDRTTAALAVDAMTWQLGTAQLTARVAAQLPTGAAQLTLDPVSLRAEGSDLSGKIQWQQAAPGRLLLDLKGDSLDLDRLLATLAPPDSGTAAQATTDTAPPTTNTTSPTPPLQNLFAMPGDYQLAVGTLVANHLTLNNVQLHATVDGSTLTVDTLRADAYQGQINSTASLTANNPASPQLRVNANIKGLQLSPLLHDLQQAPSKIAAGALTLDSQISASPTNQTQLLKTLSGNVQFNIEGLIIDEMNLEQRACEAAAQLDGKTLSARQWSTRTELRDTSGTAQIRNGMAQIGSLTAKLDTLDLSGTGVVNLVNSTMDVPLDLTLINNSQASNFCEVMNSRLAGIRWPLRCEGNFTTESGKELCGIDKSRLDKLILQAAQGKLEEKLDEKLEKKFGEGGKALKESLRGLFN